MVARGVSARAGAHTPQRRKPCLSGSKTMTRVWPRSAGRWRPPFCSHASVGCGWEQLWSDKRALRVRYRLGVRSRWWEDQVQVEALAALSAWVERYDSGEWDDPPGKPVLLYDLERVAALLRGRGEPFHPDRDRLSFARFLIESGCQPPPDGKPARRPADQQ
jgi:hypothetical protein